MKTFWHQNPQTVDRLAAEYALGTLAAPARRRMDGLMGQRPDIAQSVESWHARLGGVLTALPPLPVRSGSWERLETSLFGADAGAAPTKSDG